MKEHARTRVITFRLSEAEYEALQSACDAEHNTMSAIARRTILHWAKAAPVETTTDDRLAQMGEKLDTLLGLLNPDPRIDAKFQ